LGGQRVHHADRVRTLSGKYKCKRHLINPKRFFHRKDAKSFVLLRPRVQQNPLHPFGGANVR
ncbi:MAG: hypothetical protein AAB156_03305, partial [Pseudomonadota bacterium]